jgi:hypothetical protein
MNMATRHCRLVLIFIQWRRRYALNRMLKELGWKRGWDRAYG